MGKLTSIMRKPPSNRVSKKDAESLDEMREYCEAEGRGQCRRKHFYDKFKVRSIKDALL